MMDDLYQNAFGSHSAFNDARSSLGTLESNHRLAINELCNRLAQEIRKHEPNIDIQLRNGGIKIAYLSKYIDLSPDLENKIWMISGSNPRFTSLFRRGCGRSCDMVATSMSDLAKNIVQWFTDYFKTIKKKKVLQETEFHFFKRKEHNTDFPFALQSDNKDQPAMNAPPKAKNKSIAGKLEILGEEMAASAQPSEGLSALDNAIKAIGLNKALSAAGIKNMLSDDRQSIIFYITMDGGKVRPIVSYSLIDLTKPNMLEDALDGLGDLAKNNAPGMGKQARERIKAHENALRQAARQFLPQKPTEQKPIPQIFANVP